MNSVNITHCLDCGKELPGRIGQKFCTVYCKSAYHYKKSKLKESRRYDKVLTQLKLNRRILKMYNLSGQSQVKEELLLKEGFDFEYYTNTWTAKNGNLYYFCFEYGFRDLNDGKYMLITWQKYMEKKNAHKNKECAIYIRHSHVSPILVCLFIIGRLAKTNNNKYL